jgi:hypothetical protein
MQTINTFTSFLSYLDQKVEEKSLPKLLDFNVKDKFTKEKAVLLISNIFLSPGFFLKKKDSETKPFDFVEMR